MCLHSRKDCPPSHHLRGAAHLLFTAKDPMALLALVGLLALLAVVLWAVPASAAEKQAAEKHPANADAAGDDDDDDGNDANGDADVVEVASEAVPTTGASGPILERGPADTLEAPALEGQVQLQAPARDDTGLRAVIDDDNDDDDGNDDDPPAANLDGKGQRPQTRQGGSPNAAALEWSDPLVVPYRSADLETCAEFVRNDRRAGANCLRELVATTTRGDERRAALDALAVLDRLDNGLPSPAELYDQGVIDAALQGSLVGGIAGFLAASTFFANQRTSQRESFPWLLTAPILGGAGMALGGSALVHTFRPRPSSVQLAFSTSYTGLVAGGIAQLYLLEGNNDVGLVPLHFGIPLLGMAAGFGAGAGLGHVLDFEPGDVALANSALFWGGVLGAEFVGVAQQFNGIQVLAVVGGTGIAAQVAVLALHPVLKVSRLAVLAVDLGGVVGLAMGGIVAVSNGSSNAAPTILMVGTAAGLGVGVAGALVWSALDDPAVSTSSSPSSASSSARPTGLVPSFVVDSQQRIIPGMAWRVEL